MTRRHEPDSSTRGRGRPRDPEVDGPILRAAFRMLVDAGYSAMSVEAVAAEAGVGKTTIYRRYPTKPDLIAAVIRSLAPPAQLPASSDSRTAIAAFVRQSLAAPGGSSGVRVMGALLLEERREPGLMAAFRQRILVPRRDALAEVLRAGVERGEIRADVDLDVTLELIAGALIGRHVLGGPVTEGWMATVSEALWRSVATWASTRGGGASARAAREMDRGDGVPLHRVHVTQPERG